MTHSHDFDSSLENLFEHGLSFDKFLQNADADQRKTILELLEKTDFSWIETPETPVRILYFGEMWCPDCLLNAVALAGMMKKIKVLEVRVQPRDGNEAVIKGLGDGVKAKIPTIVPLDDHGEALGVFVERPMRIRALEQSDDQLKRIVMMKEYRAGLYIEDTAREIMAMLK
ncbi:thioredoxin family protein [Acidaminobacter hydrogenoformans]|uniref:Thioredoxin n=1 Tax=Acidaminobacter hydrogenoformans DSM 2784 TaxID=1120920 RepID=A0A1G5S6J2_9FIRM|nr:thioredoxin family protein [Acidaminobacter hydrogenoformans]SCZ81985.1 Thioredoxin [Acidaminobacter hydrogenoformans DSM 2784]